MNQENDLRRIIKATVLSLEATLDAISTAVKEINKEKGLPKDYKQGVIDATNTIGETLVDILQMMKEATDKLNLKDDCQCPNCEARRGLINEVSARTGTSKEELDAAIMAAIKEARANGKEAGAIKVNRTTGKVEVLSNDDLSDELRGAVDALARGEDVGLEEYKLDGNYSNGLNAAIKSVFTKEFDGISQEKAKEMFTNIFGKVDRRSKDTTDC